MATLTITIPNDVASRVTEALCLGVDPTAAKAKRVVAEWIKKKVVNYEIEKAGRAAEDTAKTTADSDIIIS